MIITMKCYKCDYFWEERINNPKECPRCKARLDNLKNVRIRNKHM